MKKILLATFLIAAFATHAQDTVHHYLMISGLNGSIVVVSSASEPRVVAIPHVSKDEEKAKVRYEQCYYGTVFGLIQEYEAQGWSLFQIDEDRWNMRKPKQ
jgi:hypothetical protein